MKFLILLVAISGISSIQAVRNVSLTPCKTTGLIKNKDGKVVKGVCAIDLGFTYDDGIAECARNGMDLFLAEDQYVYSSFLDFIRVYEANHVCGAEWAWGCGLFINGKLDVGDKKWYATINGKQQVMDVSFYKWVQTVATNPGTCMSVKNQNGFGDTPWNCGQPYGIICEYTPAPPTPPTPPTTTTTTAPPCEVSNHGKRHYNLAQCKSIGTIRDCCGNVVKGVCEINVGYTYDNAIQACRNVGMDLFVAENHAVALNFMQYIQGQFGKHPCGAVWNNGCGLWIGGKKNSSGGYTSVKDWRNVALDMSSYSFSTSTSPGDCIAVKNNNGFKVVTYACTQAYGPICEFDSKYQ